MVRVPSDATIQIYAIILLEHGCLFSEFESDLQEII
jgi:hypothetical protein